ncbi:NAD(P)/FAD-dependent oxidoreductase [Proteiniclasticum sp. BAD-10]|uniref:NAD(P)/FAD-dependent oxidoreductase n=1 Tax=Proteiniclasticum sediminis TaxID=2804028 RepID=A0A941CQ87_9CLOT|nr:FAD-dependent oxidoreductase [Proteiniclasticum sediminis]MBR0576242.1 NAD(P)/FAD-dependent oxidoreductase [Proteiniclasticum sediminis]
MEKNSVPGNETFLILGNGPAGHFAASEIRKNNAEAEIVIVSKEPERTYLRTQLAECFEAAMPDDKFYMAKLEWYEKNRITQVLGVEAVSLDTEKKNVTFSDGSSRSYHKLILAMGSYNFIPPVETSLYRQDEVVEVDKLSSAHYRHISGIYSIRELADALALREKLPESKKAVVIGGGLLGLEAAWSLKNCGLDVSVVEFFPRLLPKQLDDEAGVIFKTIADESGIELILGDSLEGINLEEDAEGNPVLRSLKLKNGMTLPCDLLLFSVGVRPATSLAKDAGIAVDRGIQVNTRMETSAPDVYACGDVAEVGGFVYGTWPAALTMGRVAGANATGVDMEFPPLVLSTNFNALNAKVFSAGSIDFNDPSLEVLSFRARSKYLYKKLFFKDEKLVAGILLGDTSKSTRVMKGIEKGYSKAEALASDIL